MYIYIKEKQSVKQQVFKTDLIHNLTVLDLSTIHNVKVLMCVNPKRCELNQFQLRAVYHFVLLRCQLIYNQYHAHYEHIYIYSSVIRRVFVTVDLG